MPYNKPTLATQRAQFKQNMLARTETGDAVLRRSVENVFSYAVPGLTDGLYGYLDWAVRQMIISEDSDLDSILRWANNFLTPPQAPATPAKGDVTFTGVDTTVIPISTVVTNRDGASFTTDAQYVISGTTVTGAVTAVENGAAGNTEEGVEVILSPGITDIDSVATVATGGLSGGADDEDKLSVLARLRLRFQSAPRGGTAEDFEAWALAAAGVSRAYVYENTPAVGWVKIIVIDDTSGPIPGQSVIDAAQENVDLYRPIMMGGANVIGPTGKTLNLTWADLIPATGDDVAQAKTALEANVDNYLLTQVAPGVEVSQPEIENAAQAVVTNVRLSSPTLNPDPGTDGLYTTINHSYA